MKICTTYTLSVSEYETLVRALAIVDKLHTLGKVLESQETGEIVNVEDTIYGLGEVIALSGEPIRAVE